MVKHHRQALLDEAADGRRPTIDSDSLQILWIAGVQGAIIISKASRDETVILASIKHLRAYIAAQLEAKKPAPRRTRKQ